MPFFLTIQNEREGSDRFAQLYYCYRGLAYGVAKGLLKEQDLAEDVLREAFARIGKIFSRMSRKESLKCNRSKSFIILAVERAALDKGDAHICEGVDTLTGQYNDAMLLYYVHGLSFEEIAVLLNEDKVTVESHVLAARRQLERSLGALAWEKEIEGDKTGAVVSRDVSQTLEEFVNRKMDTRYADDRYRRTPHFSKKHIRRMKRLLWFEKHVRPT